MSIIDLLNKLLGDPNVRELKKLAPVVKADWAIDAVENPDAAGPTKAIGAIKHPDNNNPSVVKTRHFLIIESPSKNYPIFF